MLALRLRVAPVPASPLLTGCGRYDLRICRDGTRNGLFRSEQGTDQGKGRQRQGHSQITSHCRPGEPKERGLAGELWLI